MAGNKDNTGRFVKGHPGGPGRPARSREEKYLHSLTALVTDVDWAIIVTKAVDDAKTGDRYARDWLSKYLLPVSTIVGDDGPGTLVPLLRERLGL